MGIWRVTVLLISLTYHGKAEIIRCYCNLEECLSKNSTCFSENGVCFSNLLGYHDTQVQHGCFHLLNTERQKQCVPGSPSLSSSSLLFCCKGDMCNRELAPKTLWTHSIIGSLFNATESQSNVVNGADGSGHRDHQTNEVWFKAATIAVPICGAMILFLLVALAFKILRADHVAVDKHYCGKAKSNANYADSHVISFKMGELNSEDASKKMPLLYEARQTESASDHFRRFATARIHFGQNVNILREVDDAAAGKAEKNFENAKINLERPWSSSPSSSTTTTTTVTAATTVVVTTPTGPVASSSSASSSSSSSSSATPSQPPVNTVCLSADVFHSNNSATKENNSNSMLDVRVDSALGLNLDKPETLSSCNIYKSPRTIRKSMYSANVHDKTYDKYLL